MRIQRSRALAVLLAAVLAGCESTAPTLPLDTPAPTIVFPSRAPSPTETEGPTPSFIPTPNPLRTGPDAPFHDVPSLEASIPAALGGMPLAIESVRGPGFRGKRPHNTGLRCRWYDVRGLRCRDQAQLTAVLEAIGKTREDVEIAVGYDPPNIELVEVQVLRVDGADGAKVRDAIVAVLREDYGRRNRQLDLSTERIAGKDVVVIAYKVPYPLGLRRYFYATGDRVYDIRKASRETVEELLAKIT